MKNIIEEVKRKIPGKPVGILKYGLKPTQVYPYGTNIYKILNSATKEKLSNLNLESTTPVASIGTCFAERFASFMMAKDYNYIRTEDDALAASANWGRVYTIPNLLQIVRYSTVESYPLVLEESVDGWFDPQREIATPFSPSKEEAETRVIAHRRASYEAFTSCEILIITVGQNEAWVDKSNNIVWGRIPPLKIIESRKQDISITEFSYEDNVLALNETIKILQSLNPNLKILFTVSPVASYAVFSDTDIVSNSFSNKCLLRTVINQVVSGQPDNLFYFPSFEMVLCDNPHNFCADNRHVKDSTADKIFSLLAKSTSIQ